MRAPSINAPCISLLLALAVLTGCGTVQQMPQVLSTGPNAAASDYFAGAELLLDRGHLDEAEAQFRFMTERWPHFASPWTNLGFIWRQQGKINEAMHAFEMATSIDASDCLAWMHLADIRSARFEFRAAESALRRCVDEDPIHADAWLHLGILYELRLGELAKALAAYERYQSLNLEKDMRVERWMVDLTRRIEQSQHLAGGTP